MEETRISTERDSNRRFEMGTSKGTGVAEKLD
jgi:hypothetical protein